ncbi:MAG: MaoC family dehydratase [Cyclobacteriaceae bacterium]
MQNNYSIPFSFSQDDVVNFANVTGDKNPIHLDEEFASNTRFKRKIIHGFLGASVFSRIFGMYFPGDGTIYLKQELKFVAPMYAGEKYLAKVEILEIDTEKERARVKTWIADEEGKLFIEGEALIGNPLFRK